jgi:hypothetical protein
MCVPPSSAFKNSTFCPLSVFTWSVWCLVFGVYYATPSEYLINHSLWCLTLGSALLERVTADPSSRKPVFDPTSFHVSFVRVFLFTLSVPCHQSYIISNFRQHFALTNRTNELSKKRRCLWNRSSVDEQNFHWPCDFRTKIFFPHYTNWPANQRPTATFTNLVARLQPRKPWLIPGSVNVRSVVYSSITPVLCGLWCTQRHSTAQHSTPALCSSLIHFIYHRH